MRLLYVEDNPVIREATLELLQQPARHVTACATAEEALAEFRKAPCEVLVTDVSLPRMSGLELARQLCRSDERVAVIILTGYELPSALEQWSSRVAIINKPIESAQLESAISRLCGTSPAPAG